MQGVHQAMWTGVVRPVFPRIKVNSHVRSASGVRARTTSVVVSGRAWVAAINVGGREQARVKEARSEPIMGMMPPTA